MTDEGQVEPWRSYIRANVKNRASILTLNDSAVVGPVTLTPCDLVRIEADPDEISPLPMTYLLVSSPVRVEGLAHRTGPHMLFPAPEVQLQAWRAASLLALEFGHPWWMLTRP